MDNKLEDTNYWESRAEQKILYAEREAKLMLVDLRKVYSQTKQDLEKEIYSFYGKYAEETGLSLEDIQKRLSPQELRSAKIDIERYYDEVERLGGYSPTYAKYLRGLSARAYMSRLEELKLQMTHLIEDLYRLEHADFDKNLTDLYKETYLRTNFDIQQGFGYSMSFSALDTKMVQTAVNQNWLGSNFADRIWTDKNKLISTLETKFTQGVALGHNPRKIASSIKSEVDTKYSNCVRLARTEFNHIANQATLDGYKEYSTTPKYKIVATLDSRTSEICQEWDGEICEVNQAQEGINFPPFHPNCRTTTIPYFEEDDIDKLTSKAKRLSDGGLVDSKITFDEWKENLSEKGGELQYKTKKRG